MTTKSTFNWRSWLPSRGNVLFTLLVAAFLLGAQRVGALNGNAPSPAVTSLSTIPYQGRLTDASGNLLNGTYTMTFNLYNVSANGSALWTEPWTGGNAVQVTNGLFSVMLGSLTPIPQSVFTGNASLWLGVTVGTDSEMTPRVQLGTVPFAVQALSVPAGAITTTMLADGAVTATKIADGAVSSAKMNAIDTYSYVSAQENTTSILPVPLATPDIVTITLATTQTLNIFYGATISATVGKPAYMMLSVDNGAPISESVIEMWGYTSGTVTIGGFYQTQLSPGIHTISARYQTQSGGTADFWRRSILVFSVSQ